MDPLLPVAPTLTPDEFVRKWRDMALKERSASQSHFNDLCHMLGWPTPTDADKEGAFYAFERGAEKQGAGGGWADVWLRGHFGWEYKGPKKDLIKAYDQLQLYRESLENPPLLIVSDLSVIEVHSNFTNTPKRVERFSLDDLLKPERRELLSCIFTRPEAFKAEVTTEQVTKDAAREFATLADRLRAREVQPTEAAHFLIRLLFCLFAEDVGLLPANLFSRLVQLGKKDAALFNRQIRDLFGAMATRNSYFGVDQIKHFNGGLFDSDVAVDLDRDDLAVLTRIASMDWASIEPSIFGTLFERSLDPSKRSQLGAHFTSREDILLIVEPVLMAPLRREWAEVQVSAAEIIAKRDAATGGQRTKLDTELREKLLAFMERLARIRVLDPACGSGNFLYVSLKSLLDLWKEVWLYMGKAGIMMPMALENLSPSPAQLYGMELSEYAHELAQVTVWIGYIQWLRDNGFGFPAEPILRKIDTIRQMDAILAYDEEGRPVEPEWPEAEVIVGNPPFLGDRKMIGQLGEPYVSDLRRLYRDRLPEMNDLVCYWFEKARAQIEHSRALRAGLLATNSIRSGFNRTVLERINHSGRIFMAWSDRPWIIEGAAVRVSIIGFSGGEGPDRQLNGQPVSQINPDLTKGIDVTSAVRLLENTNIAYYGPIKAGPFDVSEDVAQTLLAASGNPNGRPNSDVVRPWWNGADIVQRPRRMWVIDFGVDMSMTAASEYEAPFEYVLSHVRPIREQVRRPRYRDYWWLMAEPCPGMRIAIADLQRFIVTPKVARHRLFTWLTQSVLPSQSLTVIARSDDYFLGVLQSRVHECWALATCSWMGVGNDPVYNATATFETYPFPWPPGHEPTDDPRVTAIAEAARELVEKRDRWLNPEGATEAELKKRTLTNLYNARPTWLDLAHKKLDAAVFAAYGWAEKPEDLADEVILERLLALNLERAAAS